MSAADSLRDWFRTKRRVFSTGVEETREIDPERFDRLTNMFLSWAERFLGPDYLDTVAKSYCEFTTSVNMHQARYEVTGKYEPLSADEFRSSLYEQDDLMEDYLWGVYLANFIWPHHLRIAQLFEDKFLPTLRPGSSIVELAFGHGGWGLWALSQTENTKVTGIDIAASSVKVATGLAKGAGLLDRTQYSQGDAMTPAEEPKYDAGICGFVIEHLEHPERLLQALASHIKPRGRLFLTGAVTAAQEDHIYEFKRESEIMIMAEDAGFRVLQMNSEAPARTLPKAKYLPRSQVLILERRQGEIY